MQPGQSGASAVERLIAELMKLPGIGRKSAQRLVFHLLKRSPRDTEELASALMDVRRQVRTCSVCFNLAEQERCAICLDPKRETTRICVVEEPANVATIERSRGFRGLYHVLGGTISPLSGVGPEDLHVRELVERVRSARSSAPDEAAREGGAGPVEEIILATNPTVEGEATAMHLAQALRAEGVKVTRLAQGLPAGADVEYTDVVTLNRALQGRREVD